MGADEGTVTELDKGKGEEGYYSGVNPSRQGERVRGNNNNENV